MVDEVSVTGQRGVRANRAEGIADACVKGIGDENRAVVEGHGKTGMTVPFELHIVPPEGLFDRGIVARRDVGVKESRE